MTENTAIIKIVDEITACRNITLEQLHMLLETDDMQAVDYLRKRASEKAHETYGNRFYTRADRVYQLLQNDCLYCGIRHSNTHADRYRPKVRSRLWHAARAAMSLVFVPLCCREVKIRTTRMSASVR